MKNKKPHIAVFFGGTSESRDLSSETGYWMCQHLPGTRYRVTPVQVTVDGLWQVPLGSLPQTGPVNRMLTKLFEAVPALSPVAGLERLLARRVDGMITTIRGAGGDDGTWQGLAQVLGIPVVGSSAATCQQTSDKYSLTQRLGEMTGVPYTHRYSRSTSSNEVEEDVRRHFVPPVFVKPAAQEGGVGVELVQNPNELVAALERTRRFGDILVQERLSGVEVTVSAFEDEHGRVQVLPPVVIVPQKAPFYDHLSRRVAGRVAMHTPSLQDNPLLADVRGIAEEVYKELNCGGLVSLDFIIGDDATHVLEVNTVPTLTELSPLHQQLKAAGVHPSAVLDQVIRRSL